MNYQLLNGSSATMLKSFPDNHFDSVVTDPPYLIGFLGKGWDHEDNDLGPVFKECLRVLKPGGHLLAFSAARTYHKLATTIEEAGFEIRDQVMWIYASGFPKSQDVGKSIQRSIGVKETTPTLMHSPRIGGNQEIPKEQNQTTVGTDDAAKEWAGWGTQLKPAHEPICMARKPLKQTIAKNCQEWGTGAINIDAGRIPIVSDEDKKFYLANLNGASRGLAEEGSTTTMLGGGFGFKIRKGVVTEDDIHKEGRFPSNVIGDIEGYQKFYYQPKVSRKERHCGFDEIPYNGNSEVGGMYGENQAAARKNTSEKGNSHPTVKPVALMDYLIKLVTKQGGKVLDPFNGSGSTGMAAVKAGYEYTGIDLDPKYCEISRKRIDAWCKEDTTFNELFNEVLDEQKLTRDN